MKINMPVTDHQLIMKKGSILVTRTDLKGIITYANDAFVAISGFSREELIGASHNIVRHPDVPEAVFADLWQSNKSVEPWTGIIKNRAKNGDYYWVEANVTPIFDKGKLSGYLSVRYAPSVKQISEAENFYQQVQNQKIDIRPKGLALMLKNIKEIKLVYKGVTALICFMVPVGFSLYNLYLTENYLLISIFSVLSILAIFLGINILRLFENTMESTIDVCYAMASGYYRKKMNLDRSDKIGDFNRALFSMQVKLSSDLAFEKEQGSKALRMKQALDQVTSNVMMADEGLNIIYMNDSAKTMFRQNSADFQKELPELNVDTLIGTNIDSFHKVPSHQRSIIENLKQTINADIEVGGRHMGIIATPVFDQEIRLGTVVEWIDKTQEIKVQNEIDSIVQQVKKGQLDSRISMAGKDGFFEQLSEGVNSLTEVVEQVITEIAYVMGGVAEGDLSRSIKQEYEGTFAVCKNDINQSLHKLSGVFGEILSASDFINNSSQEISSGNNNLSTRAEKQASSLEETASSMEELTSTVKNNSDNAQEADQVASAARKLAEDGGTVVNSAINAMQEINESSNKIADIIAVIDEIAFQINLLALNASVEAARAGEQGRGFSVVATEVRNLAQRSAKAAKESKELIENSVRITKSGTELVNETGKALEEIVSGVKQVGDIVANIASASVEQSQGIEQVNHAITQLDEITQQNAALAEQASAASMSMSDQSRNMMELLSFFKVGGQQSVELTDNQPFNLQETMSFNDTAAGEAKRIQPADLSSSNNNDDDWEEF